MKYALLLSFFALGLMGLWGNEPAADSVPVVEPLQIPVQPGLNPVAITRFPLLADEGRLAQRLTFPEVFGPPDRSGLAPGTEETADLIWIFLGREWQRFYFLGNPNDPSGPRSGWRRVGDAVQDMSGFAWPYTAGVFIERRQREPGVITITGAAKRLPSIIPIQNGFNVLNRIYDDPITLADLDLETFFIRAPADLIIAGGRPGGPPLEADQFRHPLTQNAYVLSEEGAWYDLEMRRPVDPNAIGVPGAYEIDRVGDSVRFTMAPPPRPAQLQQPPFLGLDEGAVRRLGGQNFGPPECTCALLFHDDNRPISLYVVESGSGHAVVRVGKHPDNVITEAITVVTGQGFIGPLTDPGPFFSVEQAVRSFSSERPVPEPVPYRARLRDPERREGERRFFSEFLPDGTLALNLGDAGWTADTLLEIDLIAATPESRKIALHLPRVRLLDDTSSVGLAAQLAFLLGQALEERELVPPDTVRIAVEGGLEGATLSFDFGAPLSLGKIDICALPPPDPPVIEETSATVTPNGIVEVRGREFGERIEDLCLVLAPANGEGPSIPLRPVALNRDGTALLARVVGPIANAQPRRVMMARGLGRTRPVALGFPDVIQRQGIWAWRGIGLTPASSPTTVQPALGQSHFHHFVGTLEDGKLEITLDQPWPEKAEVSISFTANTDTVQLDSYAPELCFTVGGTTEECARRIQKVLQAAFVQGGMASANQVQVQRSVDGAEITLTVSIFTIDGVNDPITGGHLNIAVGEETVPCEPPETEDSDGDLVHDFWETDHFGMPPAAVDALADADSDGVLNNIEFALSTNPHSVNDTFPVTITLDEDDHPLITYQRHMAAPNFYHFDVETSMNGSHWERLANLEILVIQPIGAMAETVLARSLVDVHDLNASYFRLRLTPRS